MSKGWRVIRGRLTKALHVVPIEDTREHALWPACWCWPTRTEEGQLFVHHSADGREAHEQRGIYHWRAVH